MSTKQTFIYIIFIIFLGCKFENKYNSANQNENFDNSELIEIRDYLLHLYETRNPKPVNDFNIDYLENLTKKYPPNQSNIDTYYQIDFFLGFLDKRFNNEYFESDYYDIETRDDAYKYLEYPFNYLNDDIRTILAKVKAKSSDSLWIKYYLLEDELNSKFLHYDKEKLKNIEVYKQLLTILKKPPLKIRFANTENLINNVNNEIPSIFNGHGNHAGTNLSIYKILKDCNSIDGLQISENEDISICIYPNQCYLKLTKINNEDKKIIKYKYNYYDGLGCEDMFSEVYLNDYEVVTIKILKNNKLEFNWLGLYNKVSKTRNYTKSFFNNNQNTLILNRCD